MCHEERSDGGGDGDNGGRDSHYQIIKKLLLQSILQATN